MNTEKEKITCPFCGEEGLTTTQLAGHLDIGWHGWCKEYSSALDIYREEHELLSSRSNNF